VASEKTKVGRRAGMKAECAGVGRAAGPVRGCLEDREIVRKTQIGPRGLTLARKNVKKKVGQKGKTSKGHEPAGTNKKKSRE